MKTLLLFIFLKQCLSFSLVEYIGKLDHDIMDQIMCPNTSDHTDLMLDLEVFNYNFRFLIEKIQEHEDDEIKHFVKLFRMSKGPTFLSLMIVKNIFTTFYNWTEDEFSYLQKCLNDTYNIRESFYEAYDNNTEWLQESVTQETTTVKLMYYPEEYEQTSEDYSEESAVNFSSKMGPLFRVPPYKRGKPWTPVTLRFD